MIHVLRRPSVSASLALAVFGGGIAPFAVGAAESRSLAESTTLAGADHPAVAFTLAQVGPGAAALTSSLSLPEGVGNRALLVRASGPALAGLGVATPLAHPTITIFTSGGEKVASNDNWASDADTIRSASLVAGTFPFPTGSKDAALFTSLPPGQYTVQISSRQGDTGSALLEIYDLSAFARGIAAGGAADATADARAAVLRLNAAKRALDAQQLLVHLPLTDNLEDASGQRGAVQAHAVQFRNGAAWFDGKESEIVLPHVALDRRTFAVAMWIKLEDDYPGIGLVQQRADNRRNQHLHLVLRNAAPRLGFYVNDLQTNKAVTPRNGWTHLVFQYTGRAQEVWVDGQRVGARPARPYLGTTGEFQIGKAPRWSNVPAHDFKGGLRDLRVYSRALAAAEIRELAKF